MNFLGWILMGLIAGAIAKSIMKQGGGWVSTLLTGVAGGVVGGWIGSAVFDRGLTGFFSIWSWLLAIGGSLLVIWLYNLITNRRKA
jgi:uncharacterized membrane protein YeaQ/YmgE (transglycosylase-associated protein family)